jgi:hypothetical protein
VKSESELEGIRKGRGGELRGSQGDPEAERGTGGFWRERLAGARRGSGG